MEYTNININNNINNIFPDKFQIVNESYYDDIYNIKMWSFYHSFLTLIDKEYILLLDDKSRIEKINNMIYFLLSKRKNKPKTKRITKKNNKDNINDIDNINNINIINDIDDINIINDIDNINIDINNDFDNDFDNDILYSCNITDIKNYISHNKLIKFISHIFKVNIVIINNEDNDNNCYISDPERITLFIGKYNNNYYPLKLKT